MIFARSGIDNRGRVVVVRKRANGEDVVAFAQQKSGRDMLAGAAGVREDRKRVGPRVWCCGSCATKNLAAERRQCLPR